MNRTILLVALVLLAMAIFAQSAEKELAGFYDIKFGDLASDTVTRLKAKGFVEHTRGNNSIYLKRGDNPEAPNIDLNLDSENTHIVGWEFYYEPKNNPEFYKKILSQLEELHGEYDVEDDFDTDYIWYFPDDKALYMNVYDDGAFNMEYTHGNYDDDEFDYYYYYYNYFGN